ncbi:MAG TPA: protein kinase [Candidatus Polarisedimenticolia bacterium]|nr:protein kinase [Candidatus Polarisedimenticolia bacterium]
MTFLPLLLLFVILLSIGFVVWILVRATSKKNGLPQAPPPAPAATQPIPRKCPQCGAQLRPDVPEGLCPACLLQRGIATEGGAPPQSQPFTPPPIAELAKLFPQLEILEVIGQGGMGAVYKARQPSLERFVALKILTPRSGGDLDFAGRFTREARALARLSHPNIVGVYDFGTVPRPFGVVDEKSETGKMPVLHYFIMEYVDGPNLRQVEQAGKLTPREALQIIPQICAALQFAHDEGIVHRDIKPENVLIDKKGRVKIADFGLAKILGQQADLRLTGARDIMGTPHYMAPEQVEKPQEVDHRADIYSLGVVLYEMLTGELPLGKFDPPSHRVQVDVRLDEVVLRSLAKSPERRYQQVSEIKTDIENIAQRPGEAASQPPGNHFTWAGGVDYRSKQTLFGLPLVHIAAGTDPLTGKVRVAKGIIAIGGQARGVIAIGGLAMGVVSIGGAAVGAVALGGATLGILSVGGLAIALLLAFGGGALAPIAVGGGVIGYMAFGGGGLGAHVFAGNMQDPIAQHFFGHWAHALVNHMQLINAIIVIVAIGFGVGLPLWIRKRIQSQDASSILDRVHSWLALMDAGNYGGSWEMAAPYFQRVVSRGDWVARSQKVRRPLGGVLSRRFRGGTFSANGTHYEARFDTDFDGRRAAVEIVTFARQSNGDWRAIGYLVKPLRAGFRPWMWIPIGAGVLLVFIAVSNEIKRPAAGNHVQPTSSQTSTPGSNALAGLMVQRRQELTQASASGSDVLAKLIAQRQKESPSAADQAAAIEPDKSQTASSSAPSAEKVLLAEQPPVVVETYPASGAREVAPGLVEIRVRFSKPMEDGSWSWSAAWENSAPESVGAPHFLDDGRTCVMKVHLEPGRIYAWWLNSGSFKNFRDRAGVPALPYLLTFQTQSKEQLK